MEMKINPEINEEAGFADTPPSYDQTTQQHQYPTAPAAPSTEDTPSLPIKEQPQEQQPTILVQTLNPQGSCACALICPTCHQQLNIKGKAQKKSSTKTCLLAALLCILGCCYCPH